MRSGLLSFLFILIVMCLQAQTNPVAQNLPYSFTAMTPSIPPGMAIHRFGTSAGSIPLNRTTTPGNADLPFGASNNQGGWHNHGASGVGLLASGSNAAGAIIVAINTVGKTNISVSWLCRTTLQQATRDNSIALQYRVGTTGNFINVGTTSTYTSAGQSDGHTSPLYEEILPVAAENQSVVQVRWVYWESVSTGGSRDKIAVDDITISANTNNVVADRLTISGIPSAATVNTPFNISVCATDEAGQTQSSYNAQIILTQILGSTATIAPASSQTPVNGCVSYTITPLVAGESIDFEANSGTLILDQTGPIPVFNAPVTCYTANCNFTAVPVTLNENSTNWVCSGGSYNINAFCSTCATPTNTWLISPDFTFTAPTPQSFLSFTVDQNFSGPALQIFYTNNFTGNPATTTWTSLGSAGTDGNYNLDLSTITGGNIQFGIQYTASGQSNNTASYIVSNIRINSVNCGNIYENNCAFTDVIIDYQNMCNDQNTTNTLDDTRRANIQLNNIIQGQTTGTIDFIINNSLVESIPATGLTSYTIEDVELPANNQANVMKIRFSADTSCNKIVILDAQQSCSDPVRLQFDPGFNETYYLGTTANVNVCFVDENGNKSPQQPLPVITLSDDPDLTGIVSSSALPDNACYNFVVSIDEVGETILTASETVFNFTVKDTILIQPNPCVFISEIVDPTSGNDKYVEIFNGGSETADLTGYKLNLYRNGSTTIGSSFNVPVGTILAPGYSFVFRHSAAGQDFSECGILQITSSGLDANGNDAYELVQGDYVHDRYGVVGEDPAPNTSWNYADKVVTRNANIYCGRADFVLGEWTMTPYVAELNEGTPCYHCVNVTASININDTTICAGETIQFSAAAGNYYEWSGPNGFSEEGANVTLSNIEASQSGTYYVSVTSGPLCTPMVDSVKILVADPSQLTATIESNPTCIGNTVTFYANGGGEFSWTGPDNFTSDEQNPELLITSASQAGIYTVIASNQCGTSDTASVTLVINQAYEIIATASSTDICSGGSVALNVTEGLSYSWSGPGGFTSDFKNPVINDFTAENEGEYIVEVSQADPCGGELTITVSDTIFISVNESPSINVTATPNPICIGGTVTLNTTEAASYSWSGPNGFTSTLQNPQITAIQLNQEGQYIVTVTAEEGCISVDSVEVIVNEMADGTATATPDPVCIGSQLNLSASGGSTYSWSGPAGFSSTLQNPVRTITSSDQAGVYSVTISNGNGCSSTANVNVEVSPELIGTISVTPEKVCVGNAVQLSATGGTSYVWSGPAGFTSNLQSPLINDFQYNQTGNYKVIISNNSGCSRTLNIDLNAYFPPVAAAFYDLEGACEGSELKLYGNGAGSYRWEGPNGFVSNDKDPVIPGVNSNNSGIYNLIVTSPNGCTDTSSLNITINVSPVISIPNPVLLVCEGDKVQLSSNGNGVFNWEGPWGYQSTQQNPVIENIPGYMSGIYTARLTDANGCSSSAQVEVKVFYRIQAKVWSSEEEVCEGTSFRLFAEGGSNYMWTGPGGFFSTDQNPVIDNMDATKAGTYGVLITNEGGCQDFVTLDIEMIGSPYKAWATATPNPVQEGQSVQFTSTDGFSHMWSGPQGFVSNVQNPVINRVTRYNAGIYTVVIENEVGCPSVVKVNLKVNYKNNGAFAIADNENNVSEGLTEGHVFPNPTSDKLYFDINSGQAVEYRIMDAQGRTVISNGRSDANYISTDLLQGGVYYILWNEKDDVNMHINRFIKIK